MPLHPPAVSGQSGLEASRDDQNNQNRCPEDAPCSRQTRTLSLQLLTMYSWVRSGNRSHNPLSPAPLHWPECARKGCCYCSVTKSCLTLWDPRPALWAAAAQQDRLPCPSLSISRNLLKVMSIVWGMPSNHLILCHLLLLLPSVFPSNRFFSKEPAL